MTGPEHLIEGKRLLDRCTEVHEGMLRGAIAAEAQAHLTVALVIAIAQDRHPESISWEKAGEA